MNVDGENKGFNAALSETGWADGSPGCFPSMERSKINLLYLPYFGRIKEGSGDDEKLGLELSWSVALQANQCKH